MKYTLRTRILFVLLAVFSLLGGTSTLIHRQILLPSFHKLERQHIDTNVQRVLRAFENELEHLSMLTNDWSAWDDTYQYVIDHNAEYEISNLTNSAFAINKTNLIYLLDNSGKTVWGKAMAGDFETPLEVQPFDQDLFLPDFPLLQYKSSQLPLREQQASGLLITSAGPMLCAARPIIDSNDEGPSHGTLIMGRLLNREMARKVSRMTDIDYQAVPVSTYSQGVRSKEFPVGQEQGSITYQEAEDSLTASTIYPDIAGFPAVEITVHEQRHILGQGIKALRLSLVLMFVGITSAMILMLLMLQRSVITPIKSITGNIQSWHQAKQPWQKLSMGVCVSSEICMLADEFSLLVEKLDNSNNQLAEINFNLMSEAKKLKEAQSVLKRLDKLKSEFISTAAHELRTPVAIIMGYTELLTDPEMSDPFSEEQKQEFLQEISESSERLAKIIDDILDVSRIEAGLKIPLDKQLVSTELLFGKVVNQINLKEKEKVTLEIRPGTPESINADMHRINQVMENLLSNAVKYAPKESQISVLAEREGSHCRVTIADQGIGMTAEQITQVFDKFYRVDATDTAIRGLGLGMSIVKQIVEDHGGIIWVDSVLGTGTKVYFTLPITPQDDKGKV